MMGLDFYRQVLELVDAAPAPGAGDRAHDPDQRHPHRRRVGDVPGRARLPRRGLHRRPAHLHDVYRGDKGGKPTFDRVVRGLRTLQAHGVRWNALTTINHANEDHPLEVYRFLRDDLGAEFIQFIPIVERPSPGGIPTGDQVTDRSVSPGGYGAFLSAVFDEWVRRDVGRVFVQMFDTTLANYLDVPGGMCVHARTCGTAVALEHNGDLYSCDHFVEPDHLLGNITDTPMLELIASPKQVAFGQAKHDDLPALLPHLHGPVRLPRRLPQGPVHHHPRRRARPALPVPQLQGVLRPRRPPHAVHGRRPAHRAPGRGGHPLDPHGLPITSVELSFRRAARWRPEPPSPANAPPQEFASFWAEGRSRGGSPNRRFRSRQLSTIPGLGGRRVRTWRVLAYGRCNVGGERCRRVAAALWHGHGGDLALEQPSLLGGVGASVGFGGEGVLRARGRSWAWAYFSVPGPTGTWSNAQYWPSYIIESMTLLSRCGSRRGPRAAGRGRWSWTPSRRPARGWRPRRGCAGRPGRSRRSRKGTLCSRWWPAR